MTQYPVCIICGISSQATQVIIRFLEQPGVGPGVELRETCDIYGGLGYLKAVGFLDKFALMSFIWIHQFVLVSGFRGSLAPRSNFMDFCGSCLIVLLHCKRPELGYFVHVVTSLHVQRAETLKKSESGKYCTPTLS